MESENRTSTQIAIQSVNSINRRCCSFCRNPGHNVSTCNDERLKTFEHNCIIACIEISTLHGNNHIARDEFRMWLIDNYPNGHYIRAFAIRKCRCTRTNNIAVCINKVVEYIFTLLYIINQQHTIHVNTNLNEDINLNPDTNVNTNINTNNEDNVQTSIQSAMNLINTGITNRDINMDREDHTPIFNRVFNDMTLSIRERMYYILYYDMVVNTNGNNLSDYLNENKIFESKKFDIKIDINNEENINNEEDDIDNEDNDKNNLCECNICYESTEKYKFIKLNCNHSFCKDCLKKSLQNETRDIPCCAYCRANIDTIILNKEEYKEEFADIIQ